MRFGSPVSFTATDTIFGDAITLASQVATSVGASGAGYRMEDRINVRLSVNVTAITGTLTVTIEHSGDGTTWRTHTVMSGITTVSTVRQVCGGVDRYVRASWAVVTGPITFTIAGEAL